MTGAWLAIVAGLYGVLALAGIAFVKANLGKVASMAADGYEIEVGEMEISRGGVVLSALSVRAEEGGEPLFDASRVAVEYDLKGFNAPRLRSLAMDDPVIRIPEALFGSEETEAIGEEPPVSADPPDLRWLRVDEVRIRRGKVEVALPDAPGLACAFDFSADDLDGGRAGSLSPASQSLTLRDVVMRDATTGQVFASVPEISVEARLGSDLVSGKIERIDVADPEIVVTPELLEMLAGSESAPSSESAMGDWLVESATISGGRIRMDGFGEDARGIPEFDALVSRVALADVRYSKGDVTSSAVQSARLEALRLDAGRQGMAEVPMATAVALEAAFVYDDLLGEGWVEKLVIEAPVLDVSAARLERYLRETEVPPVHSEHQEADASTEPFPHVKVRSFEIRDGFAAFDPTGIMAGLPYGYGRFALETVEPRNGSPRYTLEVTDLRARAFEEKTRPLASGDRIAATFSAVELQAEQRVESVEVEGFSATVGDQVEVLMERMEEEPSPDGEVVAKPEEAPSGEGAIDEWVIGTLNIAKSSITLEDTIPGLPFVNLKLSSTLEEVPLTGRTAEDRRPQRVEVSGLEITSPYDDHQNTVVLLPTVWIHFTVGGLFASEIEKIEILNPELFVGQPLFWYIDYFQRFDSDDAEAEAEEAETEEVPAEDAEPPAEAAAVAAAEGTIDVVEQVFESATISGWKIKKIDAALGKIIVAPKGPPLGIFPFPFSFQTDIENRRIDLNLEVQEGDYVFEQLELEIRNMKGKSFINYPVREDNKNFVQTFEAEGMLFKQMEAGKVTISVTYDAGGIYGKLWAGAYGGDLNGEFNIYIGKNYAWDAWASAVGFELGPFFDALAPDRFAMEGTLDGKIVANGVDLDLERAVGDLKLGPGSMHIKSLDDIVASMPDTWNVLQRALTQGAVDVFRNYDFDGGEAKLDLIGLEGTASCTLFGPDGKRNVAVALHDERDETRKRKAAEEARKVSQVAKAGR